MGHVTGHGWAPFHEATPIDAVLAELHAAYGPLMDGHLADYIPELARADPAHFGIAIATADGGIYSIGDCRQSFTIQSISKAFVFGLALEDHGRDHVLSKVGVEPSGDAFNSIIFDKRGNRPFNPMVNAGAIATTALVQGSGPMDRLGRILDMFGRYTGRQMHVDHAVFMSEKATGHRNRAIGHLELNFGMIDHRVEEHLDLYFQQCSILVDCRDLALMAATLANGGVNPQTGQRALPADYVKNVVAVMNSCGMYDYSGEWGYRIGLPAKSGVGGGIIAVLPGRLGIGVFSPLLDPQGNSVRGIKVCEDLSQRFGLNMFDTRPGALSAVRRCCDGALLGSRRSWNAAEQAELARNATRIAVLDLQGDLDFSAVEQVVRRVASLPDEATYVILDFRRVGEVEPCAAGLIATLIAQQQARGRRLRLAHLWPGSEKYRQLLELGTDEGVFAADCDNALEWAEQDILAQCMPVAPAEESPLAAMDLLQGLNAAQLDKLGAAVERRDFAAGSAIFREGDRATHLYFLAQGVVSVHVGLSDGRFRRLTTLGPGVAFGEMALLDGENRSAEVRADTPVTVHALALDRLNGLGKTDPAIQAAILVNVGRMLSQRLRKANDEIRSWE